MMMDKKNIKTKKTSLVESYSTNIKIPNGEKIEVVKKRHKKSNSNVEEFAFGGDKAKLDEQLENFVNNYDGKLVYIN